MSKKVRLDVSTATLGEIRLSDFTPESFFETYINRREPVKLINSRDQIFGDLTFQPASLQKDLGYEGLLKVEKKLRKGFGNGNARIHMTLEQLLERFKSGSDQFYLTTQYDSDDSDDDHEDQGSPAHSEDDEDDLAHNSTLNDGNESASEDDPNAEDKDEDESDFSDFDANDLHDDYVDSEDESRAEDADEPPLRALFQPPLTNMHEKLPLRPRFFDTLVPQQVNLWMGYTKQAGDHDLSDVDVQDLGKVIPGPGSSSGLHHDHSDNLYVLFSGVKRFTIYSPEEAHKLYTVGTIFKIYKNGVIDYKIDQNAPAWMHINEDGSIVEDLDAWYAAHDCDKEQRPPSANKELDPPSFARIPPLLAHLDELKDPRFVAELTEFSEKNFPGFLDLPKRQVWLKPGDMLYLPAGWFHEVSSFPNEEIIDNYDNIHIALNYWFAPPDSSSFHNPYTSDFWATEFESMVSSCT